MAVRHMRLDMPCPACGTAEVEYTAADLDLPHFGGALQLLFECASCGFRHADFMLGSTREPTRHTYLARGEEAMSVRVVRSTSGTVRIPELGILIEPGPASDAYVTNIEGILVRVQGILDQLYRDAETREARAACEERMSQLQAAREGKLPFTFILEDPYGNSGVFDDHAKVERLSDQEAAHLKTGMHTLELQEAAEKQGVALGEDGLSSNGHGSM